MQASASLAGGLPFLIVRAETKEYGTANRLEGVFEAGEAVKPRFTRLLTRLLEQLARA